MKKYINVKLLIDSRETKIIERLENDPVILEYKTKYLDVGDFILSDSENKSFIIERKVGQIYQHL